MIEGIEIGMLTSVRIGDQDSGRAFLKMLSSIYKPERYNYYEPVNVPFEEERIKEALDIWSNRFLWSRSRSRIRGHVVHGPISAHDAIYLSMFFKAFDIQNIFILFDKMCNHFGVDIGYIHMSTSHDTDDINYYQNYIMPFSQGLTTHDLREGVPDLCRGTLFGEPYMELFDGRFNCADAHSIRKMNNAVYLQLTGDIKDVDKNRDLYESTRLKVKELLNSNVFRGSTTRPRLPRFNLNVN